MVIASWITEAKNAALVRGPREVRQPMHRTAGRGKEVSIHGVVLAVHALAFWIGLADLRPQADSGARFVDRRKDAGCHTRE